MPTLTAWIVLLCSGSLLAQTPPPPAKRLPPAGMSIDPAERAELAAATAAFHERQNAAQPKDQERLPDVEIFHKAVDWALRHDEFFDRRQVSFAKSLLAQGRERLDQLQASQTSWLTATGLVVRGYRSMLDDSVQPYGLVVPADWKPEESKPRPLLVWLLGRNDKRTELAFLAEREKSAPPFAPEGAIVLVPYGRFCNATKFAGEVDVFEAIGAVRAQYKIDANRILLAGFSMGGASVWHLAAHHSGFWCGASPGAGFAETAIYTKALGPGKNPPPSWEQTLWRWYDATACAGNLFNCPTIAYSGEVDPQKLSADLMEAAMAKEGLTLERVIGPNTAHKYHPESQLELAGRFETLLRKGRDPLPAEVRLTTYTLRYPEAAWVRVEGLGKHWDRADVRARRENDHSAVLLTTNVTAIRLTLPGLETVIIDRQSLEVPSGARTVALRLEGSHWKLGSDTAALRKQPGLTGPIDDAFMEPFLFVSPTGQPFHQKTGAWVKNELTHATQLWRDIFRGDAPKKTDSEVTSADISSKNLILWGDPSSNRLLAEILNALPLEWNARELKFREQHYSADEHMPVLIFPNPLNPRRYIVLNSGIDFREDAYGTNAKQTPKLPDWSIIDLTTPPNARWPGRVAAAGFFDELWR